MNRFECAAVFRRLSVAVLWALLTVNAIAGSVEPVRGRVVAVADGDTLTLLDENKVEHRIRLSGIDAPEKRQAFGERAKIAMSGRAFGRDAEAECRKVDRYQRRICVVRVDGKDLGLAMLEGGFAWWYRKYAAEQPKAERDAYEVAEFNAKASRVGLWSDKNPTPPWDWRRGARD